MSFYDGNGNLLNMEFSIADARVNQAVDQWLDEHPEATTTVQDGAVSPQKTTFMKQSCKWLNGVCILPNAGKSVRYADPENGQYFGTYLIEDEGKGIFAVEVKAGKRYTIIPCVDSAAVYFCKTYAVEDAAQKVQEVWSGPMTLLGTLNYTGEAKLCNSLLKNNDDRQNRARFTPVSDGYIVGCWDLCSGAFVYEGASPWGAWEAFLDDTQTDYSDGNTPLNGWQISHTERLMALSQSLEPEDGLGRLLRRGAYYRDLICSNLNLKCIGDGNTLGASAGEGYGDLLAAKLGISAANWGVNGAAVTNGYGGAVAGQTGVDGFIQAYLNDGTRNCFDDPCVFTIALGTHDWLSSAPLGGYADSINTVSFYGCYKKLIERIRALYPQAAIILMTPWQMFYNGVHWYEGNGRGYSIRDYCLAIHEIAMMTPNCWVLDMLNSSYIMEMGECEDGIYVDGIHLGRRAQIVVAHELEKILMQIIMMNGYDYVPMNHLLAGSASQM